MGTRLRLLAPTGKARVRLGQETGQVGNVQTVAQFLLGTRFDPDTGRYYVNPESPKVEATTCIIDECSMLTEDMLAAVIDALPGNCRLILVGDPYQLPPIGAGCPFVDIIEYLKREHKEKGVAELNTPRRQENPAATNRKNQRQCSRVPTCSSQRCFRGGHCRPVKMRLSCPRSRAWTTRPLNIVAGRTRRTCPR